MPASALFYHGTRTEVQLGDRVLIRRFLRKPLAGVVCYVPGISVKHEELEIEDVRQWAIRAENGWVYAILYDPPNFQPPKGIVFVERGTGGELQPDEHLE